MSDLQKKTLRILILSILVLAAVIITACLAATLPVARCVLLGVIILIMFSVPLMAIYKAFSWEWKVKGILTEDEYEVYNAAYCDPLIRGGIGYIPSKQDVHILKTFSSYDPNIIDSMYGKVNSLITKKEIVK